MQCSRLGAHHKKLKSTASSEPISRSTRTIVISRSRHRVTGAVLDGLREKDRLCEKEAIALSCLVSNGLPVDDPKVSEETSIKRGLRERH